MSRIEYRGLFIEKCNYERQHGELIDSVRIQLTNVNVVSVNPIVQLTYIIQLVYPYSVGEIILTSDFIFEDEEFRLEVMERSNDTEATKKPVSEETSNKILSLIRISFPYIRNTVENLTRDFGGAVTLPIVDVNQLFESGLEFTRLKSDNEK